MRGVLNIIKEIKAHILLYFPDDGAQKLKGLVQTHSKEHAP